MEYTYLTGDTLPFCKGCGHIGITQNTEKALQKLAINPLEVILVTDIGCHGIIDKSFLTHTVHGLHGRSVALASGITVSMNESSKKVIVFMGDGSASIGLQHIIDAAHKNYNMTVVVHNNMLYGMTGGQPSEYTPKGFKTPTLPQGASRDNHDICKLVAAAGANYVRRVVGIGDYSDIMVEAFSKQGFSLIEVIEVCPSYGMKANPSMKLRDIAKEAGLDEGLFVNRDLPAFKMDRNIDAKSLINDFQVMPKTYSAKINSPLKIMISGSAGEGVQSTAEILAKAAIISGLHTTKKGSYPVTVGIGFSSSEVIVSPEIIQYTGLSSPDVLIVTSKDGIDFASPRIRKMKEGSVIYVDETLQLPETQASIFTYNFREKVGAKNSCLYALYKYLSETDTIPLEAFLDIMKSSKMSSKVNIDKLFDL